MSQIKLSPAASGAGVFTIASPATATDRTINLPDTSTPMASQDAASVDINGGTIDNTVIGGTTKAAGGFTTVTTSGNVGVGATISAWYPTVSAVQLSTAGSVWALSAQNNTLLSTNEYLNSSASAVYIQNGFAMRYQQTDGEHRWYTAPSGAAGSSMTLSQRMTISNSGNLGIGTTSPSYQLQLSTDSAGKPSSSTWTVVSDERIKTDIIPADLDRCYEIVKTVPLKRYSYADGVYTDEQVQDKQVIGWIAQDVQQVFAKAVSIKPFTKYPDDETRKEVIEDCLDLNGSQMYAAMYGAVQKLMQKVEALETEVLLLKGANAQPTS